MEDCYREHIRSNATVKAKRTNWNIIR